jgi:hypothetical protein
MLSSKTLMIGAFSAMLTIGMIVPGDGGEQRRAVLQQYWGRVKSLHIERCGFRPGLCEGSIVLAERQKGEVVLAIRPGTWIKRGDRLVLFDELEVGHEIHVQAVELAGEGFLRAMTVDLSTKP